MVKIAIVGAGSYVFGPSLLGQALLEDGLNGAEFALIDPDLNAARRAQALGERMAADQGLDAYFSVHASAAEEALDGADYVVQASAVQMRKRFAMDVEIVRRLYPEHPVTEFGGVHGIAYSLRQISMARSLARAVLDFCPKATVLTVSNPLPRVCAAFQEEGVRAIGFCSVSLQGLGQVWSMLHPERPASQFPFAEPLEHLVAEMGGTNHLSWLVNLRDRHTGEDLYPRLREIVQAKTTRSKSETYLFRTGYLPMSGDSHICDFLPLDGLEPRIAETSHGDDSEREERIELMEQAGRGEAPFEPLLQPPSWERPMDLIRAEVEGERAEFPSLNLPNRGQIPNLPTGAIVETAASYYGGKLHPAELRLPDAVLPYTRNALEVTAAILQASRSQKLADLEVAVQLDPTLPDKEQGRKAVFAAVAQHEDLIGPFF
jgi:alpha-galactosidase